MHPRFFWRRLCSVLLVSGVMATAAISAAPAAGAATPANRNYVNALYADLLDRPDPVRNTAGQEFWANRLADHSRTNVVQSIQRSSTEYFSHLVDIAYAAYLDRAPNSGGRSYLVDGWRSGRFTYEKMLSVLIGSNEFFRFAGGNNTAFVKETFADLLGRDPSASALAYYAKVAASRGRGTVAVLIATSHEARVATVQFQFSTFLGRSPDTASLNYWVGRLSNGLRREDFDVALLSSAEYYRNNS